MQPGQKLIHVRENDNHDPYPESLVIQVTKNLHKGPRDLLKVLHNTYCTFFFFLVRPEVVERWFQRVENEQNI